MGLAKESGPPSGTLGPRPTRGSGLGRGLGAAARQGPRGNVPSPTPASLTPPTSPPWRVRPPPPSRSSGWPPPPQDHPGPRRRTASSPPPPTPGHARKALGPRVRPRHPPVGPGDSEARVSPSPAQRAAPQGCPGYWDRGPTALSELEPGWGGAPGIAPAVAPGCAWTGRARLADSGRARGSSTVHRPCGRGAPALRPGGAQTLPLGRQLAAADPGASGLRTRCPDLRPGWAGEALRTRRLLSEPATQGWAPGAGVGCTRAAARPRKEQSREPPGCAEHL